MNSWARVVTGLFMLIFGLVALLYGDKALQVLGAATLLTAVIHAATAVGQWHELTSPEPPTDR